MCEIFRWFKLYATKHFFFLCRRFNLIESKETEVLRDLEIALRLTEDPSAPAASTETNTASCITATTTTTTPCSTSALEHGHHHPPHNNNNSPTSSSHNSSAGSCGETTNTTIASATITMSAHLIDGDVNVQPICTQPESGSQPPTIGLHDSHDSHDTLS